MSETATTINICDCGCGVTVEASKGILNVIHSGGCPVEKILGSVRIFSNPDRTARAVLSKWLKGYDGGSDAARENQLFVEVDGARIYA